MIDLEDGKAPTITNAITAYLESADLDTQEMSSFGSDGASVMIGCRTGVATQLSALNQQNNDICPLHLSQISFGQWTSFK